MLEFKSKWVLVTGGSSGIGLAIAKECASRGANVAILARRPDQLIAAQKEIESARLDSSQVCINLQADVSDLDALLNVLESYQEQYGAPDYLFNSAGITYPGKFHLLTYETIKQLMDVNYLGTVYVTRACINGMLRRGSGRIINISSMAGVIGTYGYSAYGASKYAIRGFSDTIRAEYKPRGIQVSVVFPPDTLTPQLEFEKDLKPAITKELADNAGLMTPEAVAQIILKDIGKGRYTILPGFNSWFLYSLVSILGDLAYPVMDMMITSAIKSIAKRRK